MDVDEPFGHRSVRSPEAESADAAGRAVCRDASATSLRLAFVGVDQDLTPGAFADRSSGVELVRKEIEPWFCFEPELAQRLDDRPPKDEHSVIRAGVKLSRPGKLASC
jgi:hypothetical protein